MENKLFCKIYLFIVFLTCISFTICPLSAQETIVVGQVLNSADNSPIAAVNIYFKNSEKVVQSDAEGIFLIRTSDKVNTLVFSCIGFKRREIKIKSGQSVGLEMKLDEQNTLLQDVLVLPGSNPALEWMKKVRLQKKENDISRHPNYNVQSTEQNLVLMSKINQILINKRIFEQLKKGKLNESDTSMVIPLYMAQNKYRITAKEKKQLSTNIFSSPETSEKILAKLLGEVETDLNFYENVITVFGKSMVSPLSSVGNLFYDFYLADSLKANTGKQYEIHFRTKNSKNLAFDGRLWIDSTSLAITRIDAELPVQANINFIHNLRISQTFVPIFNKRWMRSNEELALNITYELLADNKQPKPEIFIKKTTSFDTSDSIMQKTDNFALSTYTEATLNEKLDNLNNTALLRTAKWLATIVLTGYIPMGKIDLGKIQQLARFTDIEGLRLNLPFRTNQKLWKNISLCGYVGYGFRNKEIKYSGIALYRLPTEKRRIIGINYTNDYRIINYNYNQLVYFENPLTTGDVDIANTILGFRSGDRMNLRKEFSASFANDWNTDIETNAYFRTNQMFANNDLPMQLGYEELTLLQYQSATFETRFSFGERTYNDHLQRIYISNYKPVFYSILEAGRYQIGTKSGNYGKVTGSIKHFVNMDFGHLNYIAETGYIFGNVPYPLLQIPFGNNKGGYGFYSFNLMHLMEYTTDRYATLHTELILNGLIMNQIPIIKTLNFREMFTFNMAYGGLSDSHKDVLPLPDYLKPLSKPYMEVGVGITNILHLFTFQSVWRLTDLNKPGVVPWKVMGSINLSF